MMKSKVNVIGLGYIGLPTALMFAKSGVEVIGTDLNERLVDSLSKGKLTFEEKGLEELFSILKEKEGLEIPKILSTHPITNDRINFAKKLIHQNEYTSIPHQELEQLFTELKK